jgi:hypothetical protein
MSDNSHACLKRLDGLLTSLFRVGGEIPERSTGSAIAKRPRPR